MRIGVRPLRYCMRGCGCWDCGKGNEMRLIDADLLIEEMRKWYWDKDKQKAAEEDVSPMDLFTHLAITTVQNQQMAKEWLQN